MNIYVANLPYSLTDESLCEHFQAYGEVLSCRIIVDRDTGRSRGFGFVHMSSPDAAMTAIAELHNADVGGRSIMVDQARPKPDYQGYRQRQQGNDGVGGRHWERSQGSN